MMLPRTALFSLAYAMAVGLFALPARAADRQVERGKYIVERVGMCTDCHTPRERGALVRDKMLQGAPLPLRPIADMPFADYAPRIAGIPDHYTEAQLVSFLETGQRPDGSMARPPMPPYRMNRADARAVAAYLKSLR